MKLRYRTIILFLSGALAVYAEAPKVSVNRDDITAAKSDDAETQYQLARKYLHGEGVPKDLQKAFAMMKAAAERGHADAMGGLGYCYRAGIGITKDERLAIEWLRKGADKGSSKARFNLGQLLLDQKSGDAGEPEQSRREGVEWIHQAADQGLPEACLVYGNFLYFGDYGIKQDYAKAAPYFLLAARQGLRDAQNFLGTMNEMGLGMAVDTVAAESWFRKAAMQGQVKAQSNLGVILNPLAANKETRIEALAWLIIAADQGEVTAEKSLQDAVPGLKYGELNEAQNKAENLRAKIRS